MKRLFILTLMLIASSACTKYEQFPTSPVSFEIGDKTYYSAKDTKSVGNIFGNRPDPEIMEIRQYGDSLDISYSRSTDFLNYDMNGLGLCIRKTVGRFEENVRMDFTAPEGIQGYLLYYYVPYVSIKPIKSSSASDEDVYVATKGWIEFDNIDFVHSTVSGKFEFDAVLNDDQICSHPTEISVRNGTFRDISFSLTINE